MAALVPNAVSRSDDVSVSSSRFMMSMVAVLSFDRVARSCVTTENASPPVTLGTGTNQRIQRHQVHVRGELAHEGRVVVEPLDDAEEVAHAREESAQFLIDAAALLDHRDERRVHIRPRADGARLQPVAMAGEFGGEQCLLELHPGPSQPLLHGEHLRVDAVDDRQQRGGRLEAHRQVALRDGYHQHGDPVETRRHLSRRRRDRIGGNGEVRGQ